MLKMDAEAMYRYLVAIFPKWGPTDEQAALWLARLQEYPDPDVVKRAIEQHCAGSRYNSPVLPGVAKEIDAMGAEAQAREERNPNNGMSGMYIQCVKATASRPGRLGWYVPLCYCTDDRVPPPHVVLGQAEAMRTAHENTYGGQWVVVQQATAATIQDAKCRLRGERAAAERRERSA